MVQRVTYRRRHCYNTKSNKVKIIKTPGGKLTVQYKLKLLKVQVVVTAESLFLVLLTFAQNNTLEFQNAKKLLQELMVEADVEVALDKEFFVHSLLKNNVKLRPALYKQPEKKLNKSNKLKKAKKPDQKEKEKAKSKCC
eukprot:CAMPEP_0117028440 /NCGR_PEP_ID=MMETSP0472-20121206/20675_1 /TAXON_ID=693140 ORGANISM="Tiarina fusus, Strain LIS" /NCGR_SAMPLE_ID=MMETSP0472 /ASSEMBLY_ACC=CAM_ASM_000603 /LENGTH=138 /DNA_ID=CAMNT_0004735921 /DNA_START=23 /DNA_END=443 /DNA_ORIENTATION=-